MELWNGKQYIKFTDVIDYLYGFSQEISDLEEKSEESEKYIFNLEEKVNDKDCEIERLQKLLDENGIDYWQN